MPFMCPLVSWQALKRCYQKWHLWVTIKITLQATWFPSSLLQVCLYAVGSATLREAFLSPRPLDVLRAMPGSGTISWRSPGNSVTPTHQPLVSYVGQLSNKIFTVEWEKWRSFCRFMLTNHPPNWLRHFQMLKRLHVYAEPIIRELH